MGARKKVQDAKMKSLPVRVTTMDAELAFNIEVIFNSVASDCLIGLAWVLALVVSKCYHTVLLDFSKAFDNKSAP